MLIKEIPTNERPRERLLLNGVEHLSNEELIAIIFNTGSKKASSKELAQNVLSLINEIQDLNSINISMLTKVKGVGLKKATTLIAAIELGKRVNKKVSTLQNSKFNNPVLVYDYYFNKLSKLKQEHFYVIYLDTKKRIINDKLLFVGTINNSVVHPREIFKEAYLLSASFIICVHNHPSGDTLPSDNDIELTKRIKDVGITLGIILIDHIIIGDNYYSFYENDFI